MVSDNYNSCKKILLFFAIFSFSFSQNNDLLIELKNGNKISGELLNKTDSTYTLKTEFGELVIPKKDISLVSDGSITNNSKTVKKPSFFNSYLQAKQKQISLNQQARWRSIYGTMLAGNILYGAGIPLSLIHI